MPPRQAQLRPCHTDSPAPDDEYRVLFGYSAGDSTQPTSPMHPNERPAPRRAQRTPTNAMHPDERNAPRRTQRTPTSATHSDERDATWAHPNEPEAQAPGPAERQRRTRPHFTRTHCSQSSATRAPCTPTSATPHEPTPTSATPHGYLARWPAGSISRCFALHAARGARAVQQTAARAAAAVAGGIWVRTWSMRSHPVHIELSTVVSEMGEH